MKDFTDLGEGTAWAAAIFILLGLFLHWFFFICALAAFGLFLLITNVDLRQQARRPRLDFLFNDDGNIVAIQCTRCGRSSDKPSDIDARICRFCDRSSEKNASAG